MTSQALGRLVDSMVNAAETLRYLARKGKSEMVRLSAARSVIELGHKLRESVELEETRQVHLGLGRVTRSLVPPPRQDRILAESGAVVRHDVISVSFLIRLAPSSNPDQGADFRLRAETPLELTAFSRKQGIFELRMTRL
jgi:hypothetical protein